MNRRNWTAEEEQYMIDNYPNDRTQVIADALSRSYSGTSQKAKKMGLRKSAAFHKDLEKSGHINLITHGANSRFKKGQVSFNKGKKQTDYMSPESIEKTKATRFSNGHTPHNTKQDGAISIRRSKKWYYKWIRVSLNNWQLLHRVVWQKEHGAIPKGYNVQFIDGNTMNCDLENLELVKRGENMRRNTIHRYPEEIKQAIRQLSKLNKTIRHAEQSN